MTAEVAILNKSAVALAADSAVTTEVQSGQKVFNTANKLFALSKYRPVGIMVHGNSEFIALPWETIIKYYRSKLKDSSFPTLLEYAEHFLAFLQQESALLWPEPIQRQYFQGFVGAYFQLVLNEINGEVSKSLSAGNQLSEQDIADIASRFARSHREEWDGLPKVPSVPDRYSTDISRDYANEIQTALTNIFQALPLTPATIADLKSIASQLFSKQRFPSSVSGIVVAGFGEHEIFPTAASFTLEAVVRNKLKYHQDQVARASRDSPALIMSFAQREMVNTFMEGIDPLFRQTIAAYLDELVHNYPSQILAAIPEIPQPRRDELSAALATNAAQVLQHFGSRIQTYIDERHVGPVINAVAALPKDDLAAMAEALVNLTSFKRKVTLEPETVGGPIDVAVISKGDGFIWIKRKHYFKPEFNQSFFSNYYREH